MGSFLFNAQLSCDHFYCVDNHFTSFVVVDYGLQRYITCAIHREKQLVMYNIIRSVIDIGYFQTMNIRYQNVVISAPLVMAVVLGSINISLSV